MGSNRNTSVAWPVNFYKMQVNSKWIWFIKAIESQGTWKILASQVNPHLLVHPVLNSFFLSFKKKKYFTKLTCNQTSQFSRFSNCKKLYISFYSILNTNMLLSDVPLIHYMFLSPTIWLISLKTRGDFGHRDKWSECFHCRLSIYWNKYWQCRWLLIPVTRLKWL